MEKEITFKKVDGLKESLEMMKMYETKYGMSSSAFIKGDFCNEIPTSEQCIWEFYIECYIECGGTLDTKSDDVLAEDAICNSSYDELMVDKSTEKGRDFKLSLPFLLYSNLLINHLLCRCVHRQL